MSKPILYLLTFLVYVFNTYIVFWYGGRLFEYRKGLKTTLCICVFANIMLWLLLIIFFNETVNLIAIVVLFWLIMWLAFKCDWKLAIFHSLILTALMWIAEYIAIFIISYIKEVEVTHFKNDLVSMVFREAAVIFPTGCRFCGNLRTIEHFSTFFQRFSKLF